MNISIKCIVITLLSLFVAHSNLSAQVSVQTSQKHELSAIAFILAQAEEFDRGVYQRYYDDIEEHFEEYKHHPLIEYIQDTLRSEKHEIGYDAVPYAANFFKISDGRIVKSPNYKELSEKDDRWSDATFERYVDLLNSFYKESDFKTFFEQPNPSTKVWRIATKGTLSAQKTSILSGLAISTQNQ